MKIIGKTEQGFITTVTREEIKALLAVNDKRKEVEHFKSIDVGTELSFTVALSNLNLLKDVRLSGSYQTLNYLENAKTELDKLVNQIKSLEQPLLETQKAIKESQS
jgi:hypothetical protein